MTSLASAPSLPSIKSLARFFSLDPPSNAECRNLVYRAEGTSNAEIAWERRIVELGEGRSVKEIIQVLYQEQLGRGARLVDIGIWKSLFDRSVVYTIGDLVDRGLIRMKSSGEPGRRNAMPATAKKKGGRPTNGRAPVGTPGRTHRRTALSRRPGLVLEFLARVTRRGPVGVKEHSDHVKGTEGG